MAVVLQFYGRLGRLFLGDDGAQSYVMFMQLALQVTDRVFRVVGRGAKSVGLCLEAVGDLRVFLLCEEQGLFISVGLCFFHAVRHVLDGNQEQLCLHVLGESVPHA